MTEKLQNIAFNYDSFALYLWPVAFKEYLVKIIEEKEKSPFERIKKDWKYVPAEFRNQFVSTVFVEKEIVNLKKNFKRALESVNDERTKLEKLLDPPHKDELLYEFLTQLHFRRIESHKTRRQELDNQRYLKKVRQQLMKLKQICKEKHASVVTKKQHWTPLKMELARRLVVECDISIEKMPIALLLAGNWWMEDREPDTNAIPSASTVKNWLDTLSKTDKARIKEALRGKRQLHLMADGSKGADNLEVCKKLFWVLNNIVIQQNCLQNKLKLQKNPCNLK